ncbi:hypothetical protein SEPCBS57363_006820, partial [Sporothrix epigloea]
TFRDQGLQVLVEISSIELSPETPAYGPDNAAWAEAYKAWTAGEIADAVSKNKSVDLDAQRDEDGWQLAGLQNEHIAAVAIFVFDAENVTEPRWAFRQKFILNTSLLRYDPDDSWEFFEFQNDGPAHLVGKDHDNGPMAEFLGTSKRDFSCECCYPTQTIGSVAAPQGRLVAFPNVLEHRIEPFRLVDATKPGRYRWLTLYLVDPHYRVCSTRNVPPQQHDWWAAAMGRELAAGAGLPGEIVDHVMQYTDDWPMGMEEAACHREQMIEEHRL